jgi:hypothetical protein
MARFRINGVSIFNVSVQWERKDDDKEIARRLINILEDRRMLWKDFSVEIEEQCVASARHTRTELTELLNNPDIGPELEQKIKAIRQAFRNFMDEIGHDAPWGHPRRYRSMGTDPLSVALGRLRGVVGVQLGEIAALWDVKISDELATILPGRAGWLPGRFVQAFQRRSYELTLGHQKTSERCHLEAQLASYPSLRSEMSA